MQKVCRNCNTELVKCQVNDLSETKIYVFKYPVKMISPNTGSRLGAYVCTTCGLTELYAEDTSKLQ